MSGRKCYMCGKATKFVCCNIFKLKTTYSETSINSVIERISRKVLDFPSDLDDLDETFSCQECVLKINEYDEAYTRAKELEQEILNTLIKTEHSTIPVVHCTKLILRKVPIKNPQELLNNEKCTKKDAIFQQTKFENETCVKDPKNGTNQQERIENGLENAENTNFNAANFDNSSESGRFNSDCEDEYTVKTLSQWHQCQICNQAFSTKRKLDLHIKTHQNKPKCELCDKAFKNEELLKIHSQIHQGISELECSECSKMFSSKGALIKHSRIHRGEYIYQCEHCGKQFIHDSSMRTHKLIHEDVREKVCAICNWAFRSTQHLKRHLRTHTGEKPHYCNKCGKQFSQKYNLMTHCRKMHSLPVRKRRFKCIKCPQVFSQRCKLSEHIHNVHGGADNRAPTLLESEDKFYLEAEYAGYLCPSDYDEKTVTSVG